MLGSGVSVSSLRQRPTFPVVADGDFSLGHHRCPLCSDPVSQYVLSDYITLPLSLLVFISVVVVIIALRAWIWFPSKFSQTTSRQEQG